MNRTGIYPVRHGHSLLASNAERKSVEVRGLIVDERDERPRLAPGIRATATSEFDDAALTARSDPPTASATHQVSRRTRVRARKCDDRAAGRAAEQVRLGGVSSVRLNRVEPVENGHDARSVAAARIGARTAGDDEGGVERYRAVKGRWLDGVPPTVK